MKRSTSFSLFLYSSDFRLRVQLSKTSLLLVYQFLINHSVLFLRTYIMSAQRMKIGCAGLGRMGKRHALNFLQRTPRAELVAASSPDPAELEWAKEHLVPFGVRLYQNYDDMLKHEGLEAIVVASATAVHAEQAIKAINADKHVLCEKPLSTSVEIVSLSKKP